ncbi:MAG TPA: 30S ribosomal protein S1 [Candidatus Binatia bacterium]|nr:30S ribosomal protein S1 [Candidatus Binatia bacterium]
MSNPTTPETQPVSQPDESTESFQEALSQFEKGHKRKGAEPGQGREATVIAVSADSVFLDIGFKTEGILPLGELQAAGRTAKPGDKLFINVKGRDPEGYYALTLGRVARVTDWDSLEKAFAEKTPILGTVTAVVKGGLSVDVGVRAFMPASRSGARDAAEMEKLVEQEIRCRIIKLDVADEDVVVDRRAVVEDEERSAKERRYSELKEGDVVSGTVRSLADYGAFIDIGGADALLHVGEISWGRVNKPEDVLSVGQQVTVQVLKIDPEKRRVGVGLKQLQAHPWDAAAAKFQAGERVRGTVTRVLDFGAFVELELGVEGLIHISEMSWAKRVRKASDAVKPGETVEVVILGVNAGERRISLGLKQALGDPWLEVPQKFPVGSVIEGPVVSLTKFGAFVQLAEGVEGMIHIGDMSAEKRLNHPQDMLKVGQTVHAQVLEVDREKRRLKLGMKQLVPTSIDEYLTERKQGDTVTGRVMEIAGDNVRVELGQGIQANCRIAKTAPAKSESAGGRSEGKADLSSLSSMLQARWKSGNSPAAEKSDEIYPGQVRSFRITKIEIKAKKIEVTPA